MCRMFGFRSVLDSHVHRSLLGAENALALQAEHHPDGWGVAYYLGGAPHLLRSAGTARDDALFRQVSSIVSSQTVLAHIRKATRGKISPLNCHPFQFGRWVMAHNGDVPEFDRVRPLITERIAPRFRRHLLGDTDSETIFHLFLTHLAARVDVTRRGTPVDQVTAALRQTVADVRADTAQITAEPALLTLVVTDGELMVAHQGGKTLYFSTWKQRCSEREGCPFLSKECESPTEAGYVNHLILSSEPLGGENVWTAMEPDELVSVDAFMKFARSGAPSAALATGSTPLRTSACG